MSGRYPKGHPVRFPLLAYFTTDIPDNIAYWERRAFSNSESARRFSKIIHESQIGSIIVKTIFASHGGWIIVGFGMSLSPEEFNEKYDELYSELSKKIGGAYLEQVEDFDNFLASDWVDELMMTVFSDKVDDLYQSPLPLLKIARAKIRLRELSEGVANEKLARLLKSLENKYLALRPEYEKPDEILEIMKLCSTITEGAVRQVYSHEKLGKIGRKTLGQLVQRIVDEEAVPKRVGFEIQTLVSYRNKVEHLDVLDEAEYELSKSDLELVISHLLDLVGYCLGQGILTRSTHTQSVQEDGRSQDE
jgi:hypothetical protein